MAAIADSTLFKATAYRRNLARRMGLTGFGRWWARELSALMPARMRAALEHRRARPVLAFDGSRATLWQPAQANGRVQMTEVAQISLYADPQTVAAAGRAALAPLVRAANGAAPQVVVALSPRASLRKTLTLPAALEDNLHQALAYDLDRHTPFTADELYFDATIVDRDAARNTLRVDLAAARRALVDPMLHHADTFGARVIAVTVDPPATALTSPINLLPVDRRVPVLDWMRWQAVIPTALVIAGLLAALILPVWQKREEAIALRELSEEARQRATASDALRTQLESKVGDYNFALERKYAFPGVFQVLDDVTRILPDDTWLTQFEVHSGRGKDQQRELTLRGESANAGQLVALLEDSKLFAQAAPRSPTTKIQPGPGEIFDVSAQLKPSPAPLPLPIDLAAPPPPPRAPAVSRTVAPTAAAAPGAAPAAPAATAPAPATAAPAPATTAPAPATAAPVPATAAPAPATAGPASATGAVPAAAGAASTTPAPARVPARPVTLPGAAGAPQPAAGLGSRTLQPAAPAAAAPPSAPKPTPVPGLVPEAPAPDDGDAVPATENSQ